MFVSTGIEDAVTQARKAAGDLDVALMGSGVVRTARLAGLLDEITIRQVPILLGGGTPYFDALPAAVELDVVRVWPRRGSPT